MSRSSRSAKKKPQNRRNQPTRTRTKAKFNPYPFERNQELTLEIESLSNQGDGVAKIDLPDKQLKQWVIFVPFTIPGETVEVRMINNQKNCSHAELVRVVKASPHRRTPACKHFTLCGGCQYQHIAYPIQLEQKTAQIEQLLKHLAGIETSVNATIASPQEFGYRSKITPHFRKPYNGKISSIGFVAHKHKQQGREYLDIEQCPIAMQEINDALPEVRKQTQRNATSFKKDHTLLLRAAEGQVETNGNAAISETVNGTEFHFLASDFFQNNPFILPHFVNYAADRAKQADNNYLVDAYCGSGLFALSLAQYFESVSGVEISSTATDWARKNASLNQIQNAHFVDASAEAIFSSIDYPAEQTTILIDPPRAGCSQDFLTQLFQFSPSSVVYISCDPATQMRDLQHFIKEGYLVDDVQPFDLFPQTKHLECIITLTKQSS